MDGIFNSGLGLAVFLLGMGAPQEPQQQVDEVQQEAPDQGSAAPLSTTPSPNGSVAPSLRAMPSTASRDVPNDVSLRLAQGGRRAWDAFQCAGFAAAMHDKEAFDGVFARGFSTAHLFLGALQKERIKRAHFESEIPSPMRASLEGPSRISSWAGSTRPRSKARSMRSRRCGRAEQGSEVRARQRCLQGAPPRRCFIHVREQRLP